MKYRRWTKYSRLLGISVAEASEILKIPKGTLYNQLRYRGKAKEIAEKLRLAYRKKHMPPTSKNKYVKEFGVTLKEMCRILGTTPSKLYIRFRDPDQIKEIKKEIMEKLDKRTQIANKRDDYFFI